MLHNCCVPQCRKKGYHSVTIDKKEAKVTFHMFPPNISANRTKRSQWIHAIWCDVSKYFKPGKWTKICSLHFRPADFYNYWSSYRALREDAVLSIFPFDTEKSKGGTKATHWLRYRSSSVKDHSSGNGSLENENTGASDGVVTDCYQSFSEEGLESSESVSARLMKRVEVLEQGLSEATEENCKLKELLQRVKAENEELKRYLVQMTAGNEKVQQHLEQLNSESGKLVKRLDLMTNEASGQNKLAKMCRFCFENIQDSDEHVLFLYWLTIS